MSGASDAATPAAATAADVAVAAPLGATALDAQTATPREVFTGPDALPRAASSGARWIWMLDSGGEPRPDALDRLLRAQRPRGTSSAAIVAGAAVDGEGRVRGASVPGFRIGSADLMNLVDDGLLPIRHAAFANCLIDTGCLRSHGYPDARRFGSYAPTEWTARVLCEQDGLYDPSSAVRTDAPVRERLTPDSALTLARMLRSGAWSRADRLAAIRGALPW